MKKHSASVIFVTMLCVMLLQPVPAQASTFSFVGELPTITASAVTSTSDSFIKGLVITSKPLASLGSFLQYLFGIEPQTPVINLLPPPAIKTVTETPLTTSNTQPSSEVTTTIITQVPPSFEQRLKNIESSLSLLHIQPSWSISRAEVLDLISGSLSHTSTSIGNAITNITNNTTTTTTGTDTFAALAPTYGQVLVGNALGGFDLVATSTLGISGGGSSQWTTSGSDIYFTGGKVGIGTSSPSTPFSLNTTFSPLNDNKSFAFYNNGILRTEIRDNGIQNWYLNSNSGEVGSISYSTPGGKPALSITGGGNVQSFVQEGTYFRIYNTGQTGGLYFNNSGGATKIGVNTTGALNPFDVSGAVAIGSYAGVNTAPANGLIVSGNVGIGTTTPNSILNIAGVTPKLTITDTSAGANLKHWFVQSSGGTFNISTTSDALADAATSIFRITPIGRVGIGGDPSYELHVQNNKTGTVFSGVDNANTGSASAAFSATTAGTGDAYARFTIPATSWVIGIDNSVSDNFIISNNVTPGTNDFLSITTAGNVGIGTTTPAFLFSIGNQSNFNNVYYRQNGRYSTFTTEVTANAGAAFFQTKYGTASGEFATFSDNGTTFGVSNTSATVLQHTGGTGLLIGTKNTTPFVLGTNNAEVLRLTSGGNVGIGTTSPFAQFSLLAAGTNPVAFAVYGGTTYDSENGRAIILNAGDGADGLGGIVTINAGSSTGAFGTGGSINLTAGAGGASGIAGNINITGGTAGNSAVGGNLVLNPGRGNSGYGKITLATAGGLVGIASTTPWGLLSVNPSGLATGVPQFVVGSSTATKFIVTNAGKVGVGLTNPTSLLEVSGSFSAITSNLGTAMGTNITAYTALKVYSSYEGTETANLSEYSGYLASAYTKRFEYNATGIGFYGVTPIAKPSSTTDLRVALINLGLYTTGGASPLDLNGGTLTSGVLSVGSTTPWGLVAINPTASLGSAPAFVIGSSTGTKFIVANNDYVGIGTSSPYSMLSVAGQVVANNFVATSTNATSTFAYDVSIVGTLNIARANGSIVIGETSGAARGGEALDIQAYRTSVAKIASGSESIAVGHNNVSSGIAAMAFGHTNTVSATYATAVGYLNSITTNYGSVFGRSNSSSGVYGVALGYNNTVSGANSIVIGNTVTNAVDTSLMIGPSDAAKMTILGGAGKVGYVGIGTTTPWRMLSVTGTVGFDGLTSSATGNAVCITANKEITDSGGTGCNGVSSQRYKHDIGDLDLGLTIITALRPVSFKYNQGYGDNGAHEQLGLIAEEVNAVNQRLVVIGADGLPETVRYNILVPVLIKAIQELNLKVETLTASSTLQQTNATDLIAETFHAVSGYFETLVANVINAKQVKTETLCVGETCVTEAQLKTLLQNNGMSGGTVIPPGDTGGGEIGNGEETTEIIENASTTETIVTTETVAPIVENIPEPISTEQEVVQ